MSMVSFSNSAAHLQRFGGLALHTKQVDETKRGVESCFERDDSVYEAVLDSRVPEQVHIEAAGWFSSRISKDSIRELPFRQARSSDV
jgi:hypothetical protein